MIIQKWGMVGVVLLKRRGGEDRLVSIRKGVIVERRMS